MPAYAGIQLFLSSCLCVFASLRLCVFARNNLVRAKAQRTQRVLGSTALAIQFAKREAGSLGESRASPSPSLGRRREDMEVRFDLPPGLSLYVLATVIIPRRARHDTRITTAHERNPPPHHTGLPPPPKRRRTQ